MAVSNINMDVRILKFRVNLLSSLVRPYFELDIEQDNTQTLVNQARN